MGRDYSPILSGASERNFLGCFTGMKAKRRTKCLILKAKCQPRPCSSCRGTKAAFGCVAVVKPHAAAHRVNPGLRFYDRFALERSLRSSAAATGDYAVHMRQTGRPPRRSVLLICPPSRKAVRWGEDLLGPSKRGWLQERNQYSSYKKMPDMYPVGQVICKAPAPRRLHREQARTHRD